MLVLNLPATQMIGVIMLCRWHVPSVFFLQTGVRHLPQWAYSMSSLFTDKASMSLPNISAKLIFNLTHIHSQMVEHLDCRYEYIC